MPKVVVCTKFRPLNLKEKGENGDSLCIKSLDSESFIYKDEKEDEFTFWFDRVFYQGSEQADVYDFLAVPIVRDIFNGTNGTIITYGQTGAGKTYSMEGPSIRDCHGPNKGLLPRVVDGIFGSIESADEMIKCSIKLSMVEIYMEKVRDLFDLSKDNLQIKESKGQGIFLSGATEVSISDPAEALRHLSHGISNRAVGETQMNLASSRSHCSYIFTVVRQDLRQDRIKTGKLILVDLAGSEKAEKTGAEGKVLEEAKTINKSLSALGNVINALTSGSPVKTNHVPFRDSKLTRILQDALSGNSRTAVLCCCSPSNSNALETLSTLRFGARAKHIKTSARVTCIEDGINKKQLVPSAPKDERCSRILSKLRETMEDEQVRLLEELFILEGIFIDPSSIEDLETAHADALIHAFASLYKSVDELKGIINKLKRENYALKAKIIAAKQDDSLENDVKEDAYYCGQFLGLFSHFYPWFSEFPGLKKMFNYEGARHFH